MRRSDVEICQVTTWNPLQLFDPLYSIDWPIDFWYGSGYGATAVDEGDHMVVRGHCRRQTLMAARDEFSKEGRMQFSHLQSYLLIDFSP